MEPQVRPTRAKKPRSCGTGNIWHPILDKCMTLDQYMAYEKFYGPNSKAAQEMRNNTPDKAIASEINKRKSQ